MPVDLRLMRYVITVAEEGGFQRAADRLHMAQPPLSRQIRDLERELGVILFYRRPAVRPTQAGRVFIDAARSVLAETDLLIEKTILAGRGHFGTIRIGYILSAAYDTLPTLVTALTRTHPGVKVEAREGWSPDLDTALLNDELDVVLSRSLPDRPEYAHQLLRRERLIAVVDAGHPLATRPSLNLRELAGQTFCFYARCLAPAHHDNLIAALEATGETFQYWENPVPGLRHLNLTDRQSFTLMPATMAGNLPAGTATIPVTDDLPTLDLQITWKHHNPSPTVNALLDTARKLTHAHQWDQTT